MKKIQRKRESENQVKNIIIRKIASNELAILEDLLYEAVFQPDENNPIPREVIDIPEIRAYIAGFGNEKDDYCLVADLDGQIIGGVWVRILANEPKGYGNIDDTTPEFAVSVFKKYRNCGIGTRLMKEMIAHLTQRNYSQVSLSVQKANYAVKMYKKSGFEIIDENQEDYIMRLTLRD